MNARNTLYWLVIAAVLFAAILAHERFGRAPATGPAKVLPGLKPEAVTSISVQIKGQRAIRAERTNDTWYLTQPVPYPAQAPSIQALLAALERLTPAAEITPSSGQSAAKASEEQGFAPPQASLLIQQQDSAIFQLDVGARTAPGDQVYLQVFSPPGVYVVDADLLSEIPHAQDDWRDTALIDVARLASEHRNDLPRTQDEWPDTALVDLKGFDHIAVTNRLDSLGEAKVIELQRDPANNLWRIVNPPKQARADAHRLATLLEQLASLRVKRFVSDEPKPELEAFGLHLPQLEVALASGTNTLAIVQFGKSPTNAPATVYARRAGQNTIVTVSTNGLAGWREQADAFRAADVLDLPDSIRIIEVGAGQDRFSLQQQSPNKWLVLPRNLPADADACTNLLYRLGHLAILEPFDAVTAPELAQDGLAGGAVRKLLFRTAPPAPGATNPAFAEIDIGATNDTRVFVKRADESSVYAVSLADIQRLPVAFYQMREHRIWNFSDDDLARVTVRCQGRVRQLVHTDKGPQAWSLASGSTGEIEPLAVGDTLHSLAQLTVTNWVGFGAQCRQRCGVSEASGQIALELKDGRKPVVELGGPAPGGSLYGAVTLDGEPWVFEFDPWDAKWIQTFLLPPP